MRKSASFGPVFWAESRTQKSASKQSTTTEFSSLSRLNTEIDTKLSQIVSLDEYSLKQTQLCLKWM